MFLFKKKFVFDTKIITSFKCQLIYMGYEYFNSHQSKNKWRLYSKIFFERQIQNIPKPYRNEKLRYIRKLRRYLYWSRYDITTNNMLVIDCNNT